VRILANDSLEAGDLLAESAEFVGFFNLPRLLAQAELNELLASGAETAFEFRRGEFKNFFGLHNRTSFVD
jgi:hypothetical protein